MSPGTSSNLSRGMPATAAAAGGGSLVTEAPQFVQKRMPGCSCTPQLLHTTGSATAGLDVTVAPQLLQSALPL